MGESRHSSSVPAHLYLQHPTAIHSESRPSSHLAAAALPHQSASLSVQGRSPRFPHPQQPHPQLQHLHPILPHALAAQPPALLLLQPLLQLSAIEPLQHYHSPLSPIIPTVIVSPHYQPPTAERETTRTVVKKPSAKTARQHLDGNKSSEHSVHGSAPAMTPNGVPTMGSKREEPATQHRAQRPSIVSQHSNSVPSTPLQVARQCESRSRSPSPNGGLGSHSPRSVSSEANGSMPTLRTGRPFRCKYETNAAFGRRRIPYTSSDLLEKAKEEPKKALEPHEDDKLSGDMRELYDRLLPSQENSDRRDKFVTKLQTILETEWPGNKFKVHVFGSSGNMLYTSESDVDICIETPMRRLEEMHQLAEVLDKHGMERVVCVPQAKVRIVKVWDPELKLACDMNVNNTLALDNTRMIKTYIQIDDRVRPLAMIIKYWTKQRILNDAALGGTISSYTWICMILNFLQTRDPPILPSLHKLRGSPEDKGTGKPSQSEFADDLEKLRGFGDKNKETLGRLLFHFFRLYGHEVDYEKHVISVREGRLLTREEKHWHLAGLQKEARNRLCVEEPFNTERNLGNSADDFAWRGIHLEIRRAFDFLADGQHLEKACEQFEFPPEEKSNATFRKPQSQKPTLTSSVPTLRSGRGGSNHRGGRGGYNSKGQYGNGRRASSGTSYAQGRPTFLHSPPISAIPGQEYFSRGLNEQLHDQLFQQYQMLEMQSNSLRAQLAAQQRAQQAHQVQAAHMHAQAVAQAQAQNRGPNSTSGSPQKSPYVNGRSSPRLAELGIPQNALPQGFLYHYPGFFDPSQANTAISPDGSRTNPSSPSLTTNVPNLRRGVHRASNASDTGSIRSQSQPARAGSQPAVYAGYPPMPQFFDPATLAGYPIARSTPEGQTLQSTSEPQQQYSPLMSYPESVGAPVVAATPAPATAAPVSSDQGTAKDYAGYYVAPEQAQSRSLQDYSVPQIPSFNELAASRRRRVSPEITQPLLNTALRRVSRSPSPLGGHVRSYSTSVAPSGNSDNKDRIDSTRVSADNGPVIVNGSFPLPTRDARSRSDTLDALVASDMQNQASLGIFANLQDQYQMGNTDNRQQLVLEQMQKQKDTELLGAPIVNGSIKGHSVAEVNGLTRVPSENSQPFPSLTEGWMNYQSRNIENRNHIEEISPTSHIQPPHWRGSPYANGLSALDTLNAPRAPPQEIKSAGLPLLSPVFETRTPSPTASRQSDTGKLVNGSKSHARDSNNASNRRASHTAGQNATGKENARNFQQQKGNGQASDRGNKSNAGNNNAGSWQQSRKKNKKAKNKGPEQKSGGEPLPVNAADRKGG